MLDDYKLAMDALEGKIDFESGQLLFGSLNHDGCYGRSPIVCRRIGEALSTDEIETIVNDSLDSSVDRQVDQAMDVISWHSSREDIVYSRGARRFLDKIRLLSQRPGDLKYNAVGSLFWIVTKADVRWLEQSLEAARAAEDEELTELYEETIDAIAKRDL